MKLGKPQHPTADNRWKLVDVVMRRNGYTGDALIETLHAVQDAFGHLEDASLAYVARCLNLPFSKVYGVATFYHLFALQPKGKHTCVICTGTACYIKGADELLQGIEDRYQITCGETTTDQQLTLFSARCLGSCGLAPAAVVDGQVLGNQSVADLLASIEETI